jgi:hypothetical protein
LAKAISKVSNGDENDIKKSLQTNSSFANLGTGVVKAFAKNMYQLSMAVSSENAQSVIDFKDKIEDLVK